MLKGFIKRNRGNSERTSIKRWSIAEERAEIAAEEIASAKYTYAAENFRSEISENVRREASTTDEAVNEKLQQLLELGHDHFST